jgi:hypothetical protein
MAVPVGWLTERRGVGLPLAGGLVTVGAMQASVVNRRGTTSGGWRDRGAYVRAGPFVRARCPARRGAARARPVRPGPPPAPAPR